MKTGVFGKRGVAFLQIWLLVFGFVGMIFMVGVVSGGDVPEGSAATNVGGGNGNKPNPPVWGGDETDNYDSGTGSRIPNSQNPIISDNSLSSKFLKLEKGGVADTLASGLEYAFYAYIAGQFIGSIFGLDQNNIDALSTGAAVGTATWKAIDVYANGAGKEFFSSNEYLSWIGQNSAIVGVGVGVLVFALMYKDTKTETITFSCMPWQAPNGGNDCEICNDDDLPCSEYRCKSLGQSCELVNEGTEDEKCVYVNPNDVVPPVIRPNYDELTPGHNYKNVKTSPPGPGFEIVNLGSGDGCLKAFTALEFGITTDEPAQCKIDINSTTSFDDMAAYFGGSNLYSYNHTESFSLPGASELSGSGFSLTNGKDVTFYLRCRDKNGNTNEAEYAVEFCIDPSPDTTPAKVEGTSIENGGCVAQDTEEAEVVFYLNEPATCRWSFSDQDYDVMEYGMSCSYNYIFANGAQLFPCSATLTGIPRDGSNYYVRCKDQPGEDENDRNENAQSFEFNLRGSSELVLKNVFPNETVFGGVSPTPVELYAETYFGCDAGLAVCAWSSNGRDYVEFYDTYNEDGIHTQRLDLVDGEYEYYVRCVDDGGNVAETSVEFDVEIDTNAPVVARVYEEGGMLKIVTVRNSECSYSLDNCDFTFSEGTEMPYGNTSVHVAEWNKEDTYYIKCRDEYLNEGADCSLIVRPTSNFL